MAVGIITGTGTYALPGFAGEEPRPQATAWGTVAVTRGTLAGVDVLHVSRHGPGHPRLSNHVNHRANVAGLAELGADRVIGCTACGAVDPGVALGSLVAFDDLHFAANRLPDGSLATFHLEAGRPGRGHWIYAGPYADPLRRALVAGAETAGRPVHDGGCYGHVDGPRFNTAAEIRSLAAVGVTAVSQTGGPETALCGEAGLPYALVGYATDYANGVQPEPTPVAELMRLMGESTGAFAAMLEAALPAVDALELAPTGTVYAFDP